MSGKKCPECPDEGLPGWMGTFADMMTLLFAFFVLLYSMSTPDPVKYAAFANSQATQTGGSTDLAAQLKQQEQEQELKKQQEVERQKQQLKEATRIKDATEQSEKNQQLIKGNTIQYSAFAIPPYRHDRLPEQIKPFASRLPEIEKFRRVAALRALATGNCMRVESVQLSVQSQMKQLIFSADCSSAKTFHYKESELIK